MGWIILFLGLAVVVIGFAHGFLQGLHPAPKFTNTPVVFMGGGLVMAVCGIAILAFG